MKVFRQKRIINAGAALKNGRAINGMGNLQRTLGMQTKYFVASYHGPVLDKVFHVQPANNHHERLKSWIQRKLRRVATKYLPNYLARQRLMSWNKEGVSAAGVIASALGRQVVNT